MTKTKEYSKGYYSKNKDKIVAYSRAYRDRNRESVRAYAREYARKVRSTDPTKYRQSINDWRKAHPEATAETQRKWRTKHPRKVLEGNLKKNYKLSFERFSAMVIEQLGRCYTCKIPCYDLEVDHNHLTKVVRRLLCGPCNRAIGLLKENPDVCEAIAYYLREHNNA